VQPLQVAIEAMILSVKLDNEYAFGVDFQLLRDQNNLRLVSGSPLANLAQFNLNGDGLRFGFLDSSTAVFINALETIGETNVVASPRVLCLNKQRAEILIGRQIGYVSTTVTENASTQSVEFLEVGTQLRIRPFIAVDGTIRLEVHPELSTGTVTVQEGFTLPEKEVTQVTTNVMCHDGSTVVIGGLIREDLTDITTQIPLLGSLPYLGPLFRQTAQSTDKHEVIILITPRLVSGPSLAGEGKQAQREFAVRHANFSDKMSPIAKCNYAKHYLRLAYAAWNAGDTRTALRYSNLAVHFDPMNLEASNLRSEVAATMPEHDNNLHYYLKDGLRPWEHPHRDYTKLGYPWSPGNPPDSDIPILDAYDPGTPGSAFNLDPGPPPVREIHP
jgi:type IV pilus assembly protein PilQ